MIGLYRSIGTTFLGGQCRFEPSCSCYAAEVVKTHNLKDSLKLITYRLCRCHPWGGFGYDPVPSVKEIQNAKSI